MVQPSNCRSTILRVLNRFNLPVDETVFLKDTSEAFMVSTHLLQESKFVADVSLGSPRRPLKQERFLEVGIVDIFKDFLTLSAWKVHY